MRLLLALALIACAGCNLDALFRPIPKPPKDDEKCYLVIAINGQPQQSLEVPCEG